MIPQISITLYSCEIKDARLYGYQHYGSIFYSVLAKVYGLLNSEGDICC